MHETNVNIYSLSQGDLYMLSLDVGHVTCLAGTTRTGLTRCQRMRRRMTRER